MIDLSLLNNIDFSNSSTLIFLAIILILFIFVFVILVFLFAKVIIILKKLFSFKGKSEKSALEQKYDKVKEEDKEAPDMPRKRIVGTDFMANYQQGEKIEEKANNIVEIQHEKGARDIAEGLANLKSNADNGKEIAGHRMPSRQQESQEDNERQKIEIPRAKHFGEAVAGFEKIAVTTDRGVLKPMGVMPEREQMNMENQTHNFTQKLERNQKQDSFFKKPDIVKNIEKKDKGEASAMFGDKEEISRIQLKYKMLKDPKIWKAQKDLRMNLSPVERTKLEKEFAPIYGRNISKKDLKLTLKKMGREWAGATDMKRKEFLRKEIKFFKKIGGIK